MFLFFLLLSIPYVASSSPNSVILWSSLAHSDGNLGGSRDGTSEVCRVATTIPPACFLDAINMFVSFNASDSLVDLYSSSLFVKSYLSSTYVDAIPSSPDATWSQFFADTTGDKRIPVTDYFWTGSSSSGIWSSGATCRSFSSGSVADVGTLGNSSHVGGVGAASCDSSWQFVCACTGFVPATRSPTASPTPPTRGPTASPTFKCTPPTFEPTCELGIADADFNNASYEEPQSYSVFLAPQYTYNNGTVVYNVTALYWTFHFPACSLHNTPVDFEESPIVLWYVENMTVEETNAFLCKNPSVPADGLNQFFAAYATFDDFPSIRLKTQFLAFEYVYGLHDLVITEAYGPPGYYELDYCSDLTTFVMNATTTPPADDLFVAFIFQSDPILTYISLPNYVTTDTGAFPLGGVQFILVDLDSLMEFDARKFTGVSTDDVGAFRTMQIQQCRYLERIRIDSWIHFDGTNAFIINPISERFANSFPYCDPNEVDDDVPATLALIANCTAPSSTPDHDYLTACVSPIVERCSSSSDYVYSSSCWIGDIVLGNFTVSNGYSSNDLKLVDCVLDANRYVNVTDTFRLANVAVIEDLTGLERIIASRMVIVDSRLPVVASVNRIVVTNVIDLSNVVGMRTLAMDLSSISTSWTITNCSSLENITATGWSTTGVSFTFSNNSLLESSFPSCVGTMTISQFSTRCFTVPLTSSPSSLPTSVPTSIPTSIPTHSPTPTPTFLPTIPPTSSNVCVSPVPVCSSGTSTNDFADLNVNVPHSQAYFIATSVTLPNGTVVTNSSYVLVTFERTSCYLDTTTTTIIYYDVDVRYMSYASAFAFFCNNTVDNKWEIVNRLRAEYLVDSSSLDDWFPSSSWSAPNVVVSNWPDLSTFVSSTNRFASLEMRNDSRLQFVQLDYVHGPVGWSTMIIDAENDSELRIVNASQLITTATNAATNVSFTFVSNSNLAAVDLRDFTGVSTMLNSGTRTIRLNDSTAFQRLHLDSWTNVESGDSISFPSGGISPRFTNSFPSCPVGVRYGVIDFVNAISACTSSSTSIPSHDYYYACTTTLYERCVTTVNYDPTCWVASRNLPTFIVAEYSYANASLIDCVLDDNHLVYVGDFEIVAPTTITDSLKGLERLRVDTFVIDGASLPNYIDADSVAVATTYTIRNCIDGPTTLELPLNATSFSLSNCDTISNLTLGKVPTPPTNSFTFSSNVALETNYPNCVGTMDLSGVVANCFPAGYTISPTTAVPTHSPVPTPEPTLAPVPNPTKRPHSNSPTISPTTSPTTKGPTKRPTFPTFSPTSRPTTRSPTFSPTTKSPTPLTCEIIVL